MRDDYDISCCLLGPPKLASKFGYELRLFDDTGFAYRGPMLSAAVERSKFWTQVRLKRGEEREMFILISGISSAYSELGSPRQLL